MEPGRVHLLGPYDVPGFTGARHVRAYVPTRSRDALRPLLFLFDGQNAFDDAPSFAGGLHAHTAVERLARAVSPPVVLAIDHGHAERIRELSPFTLHKGAHAGPGHGAEFVRWIVEHLLPQLRGPLALDPDPRRAVIGGTSMGGLAALTAHAVYPETFGGALAMSPSLWVAGRAAFELLRRMGLAPWSRVYIDAGRREAHGITERNAGMAAELLRTLHGESVRFRADPKGRHREVDWRRRLPAALRFFYGTSRAQRPRG